MTAEGGKGDFIYLSRICFVMSFLRFGRQESCARRTEGVREPLKKKTLMPTYASVFGTINTLYGEGAKRLFFH